MSTGDATERSSGGKQCVPGASPLSMEGSTLYYDERYRCGYMDEWPREKLTRVRQLLAEQNLPESGSALDFGCGTGVFTAVLRDVLPGWQIHGTDISGEALKIARRRVPECQFHSLAACENLVGKIDLVFSHHVLEHVPDLSESARFIAGLLKPQAAMFHILPCGDAGGIEHYVSRVRADGINREAGGRYFFEESGHLRRLTTHTLAQLWSEYGFRVAWSLYANHLYGAIEALTQIDFSLRFLLNFADPRSCRRWSDRGRVLLLRCALIMVWVLRKPYGIVKRKLRLGLRSVRDHLLFSACVLLYPVSVAVETIVRKMASTEWENRRQTRGGNEMYVFLTRSA